MYTRHFGLTEKPFRATPDPRFFYPSPVYEEGYATLLYGILERKGFIVLTGEVGTGKTLLLRRLMEQLALRVRFVFVYHSTLNFEELVDLVCAELGLPVNGLSRPEKLARFNECLLDEARKGGTVALLLDEAQHLGPKVLENVRLISNFETTTEKLIQIVLVGQPELDATLADPALRQIAQRVAVRYSLRPLPSAEVESFIRHRLACAGRPRQDLFSRDAVERIGRVTHGIPRLINMVCDAALLLAFGAGRSRVTGAMIDEVVADLRLQPMRPRGGVGDHGHSARAATPLEMRPIRWRRPGMRLAAIVVAVTGLALLVPALPGSRVNLPVVPAIAVRDAVGPLLSAFRATFSTTTPPPATNALPRVATGPPSGAAPTAGAVAPPRGDAGAAGALPPRPGPNAAPRPSPEAGRRPSPAGRAPIIIPAGATITAIVAERYPTERLLALDLVAELNAHIGNIDRIVAGQPLWLPDLGLSDRVRQQRDGSYRLILTALNTATAAAQIGDAARKAGYVSIIDERWLTPEMGLYRVELTRLGSRSAVTEAWGLALRRGWTTDGAAPSRAHARPVAPGR